MTDMTRRAFLRTGAAAGGGLLVSFSVPGLTSCTSVTGDAATPQRFNAFLALDGQGLATVRIPVPEFGQGVRTSLAILVAEELDIDWTDVRLEQADAADDLGPQPAAAGSNAVRMYWLPLREAGATARAALVAAAAARWDVQSEACVTELGRVRLDGTRRSLRYGELVDEAAHAAIPETVQLKDPSHFRLIGHEMPHLDTPGVTRGAIPFGIDVRVPGMLRAVIARPPALGATVRAVDDADARQSPGVRHVLRVAAVGPAERPGVSEGVAVVAADTWSALQGRDALRIEWEPGPNALENTDRLHAESCAALDRRLATYREEGNVDAALAGAARRVSAVYHVPFLAHAPMEPQNCTVHVRDGAVEIWAPTQVPVPVWRTVARELDLPPEAVTVHVMRMGGGFGRRLTADYVLEAVQIARQIDSPVQLLWTRGDDMRHGFLRPFSYHRLEAGLDSSGRLAGWLHRQAGTSRYAHREGEHPGRSEFRAGTYPAALAHAHRLEYRVIETNLLRGPLRAPGLNAYAFAVESFMDEVAHAAARDPLALRLELLAPERALREDNDDPIFDTRRMSRVLEAAADRAGWGTPLPDGQGRGIAAGFTFGTYVAHVVTASVDERGAIRVHHVASAIDCGRIVSPNGVRAQVEGGVMDGLGATLHGEITIENGAISQSNFHDYPLLRFNEAPRVDVVGVGDGLHPPTGVGEPPYPPVMPAVANAVFAATGTRLRRLPLTADRMRAALAAQAAS
jgi:isoquinoline 1-oxidoreductase subunit beta